MDDLCYWDCRDNQDCGRGQKCIKNICLDDNERCKDDNDCWTTEACQNGMCLPVNCEDGCKSCMHGKCLATGGATICHSIEDCDGGQICDLVTHLCREEIPSCLNDNDCPLDKTCVNSQCLTVACSEKCPPGHSCQHGRCEIYHCHEDKDCGKREMCDLATYICVPDSKACEGDDDCGENQSCKTGKCKTVRSRKCKKLADDMRGKIKEGNYQSKTDFPCFFPPKDFQLQRT